jgi:outer membrane protein TolC
LLLMKSYKLFPLLCIVAGCRAYTPAPIDWAHEQAAWAEQSAAAPVSMTLAEAKRCALFLNPEINALRVRHLASSNAVLQTGWWDDPELGVDALRFLKSAPHPWIFDSTVAFTVPINGVPALERKAAEAYTFADACAIIVAERELMANVERAWYQFQYADDRRTVLSDFLEDLDRENERVKQMVAAGELDAAEGARLELEILRIKAEIRRFTLAAETHRLSLHRLIGLHPSVAVEFDDDYNGYDWGGDNIDHVIPTEETLIRHPRVQEKLARLGASEADLRTEIRRQYPNLKIGPALQSEDGSTRAGLTFGMTLPLWNRNRRAVAEAEGARESARIEAVNEWKRLVSELALAKENLRMAEENMPRCFDAGGVAVLLYYRTQKLYEAGEADIVAYITAYQTRVTTRLNSLDAQRALRDAEITLSTFKE